MKNLLLILVALFFAQCQSDNKTKSDGVGYNFDVEEILTLNKIDYPELLGNPMQIFYRDNALLINDFYGDSLIHVYDLETNKITRKLVRKGVGPNELLPPLELQFIDEKLWVYSRPLHMMNHISLSELHETVALSKTGNVDGKADCFVPLSNGAFVFSGLWDKRYALINVNNKDSLVGFGEYPDYWSKERDFPSIVKAMFHQSRFAINTEKKVFASCSYFVLELYKYTTDSSIVPELKMKKQLGHYEYDYINGDIVKTKMKEGCDLASIDVVSGNKYLYVLIQDAENRKNRNIMILDWDGNPIKLLKSGKRIICFSIDEENKTGYCIVEDTEYDLYSFKIQ